MWDIEEQYVSPIDRVLLFICVPGVLMMQFVDLNIKMPSMAPKVSREHSPLLVWSISDKEARILRLRG